MLTDFYADYFAALPAQKGLKRPAIVDRGEVQRLTAYFCWASWAATATRPGADYSYTNNWPPEPMAGNRPTAEAFLWSVLSLIALLGGIGLMFFVIGRYDLLGWHRADEEEPAKDLRFRPPEEVRLAPAQRAMAWYFLVVAGLFLLQGLLGVANAHYHVEPGGFYGIDIGRWLPYNLSRMWHLQLALFFVTASFMAMGIFIAPMIAGREPKHQDKLAMALFGAVVVVVLGSLAGEAASIKDLIPRAGPWYWFGTQGWEYLDLGRFWQILLVAGLLLWVGILFRGLHRRLPGEHPGNLPYLFLYSALSIPVFYAAGLAFGKNDQLRGDRLLAFLGSPSLGGRLPGTIHHHHRGLCLRVAGGCPARHRHPRRLPRRHPLFRRRRGRHHAPPLFQRRSGGPHVAGGILLGHGSDSAGVVDVRGLAVHALGRPASAALGAQRFQRGLPA